MATVADIREKLEEIIEALTPGLLPLTTYRVADGSVPLEALPVADTADETTRHFRVQPLVVQSEGQHNGSDVDLQQGFLVQMRYYVGEGYADAWQTAADLAADDSVRILVGLLRPNTATRAEISGLPFVDIRFSGSRDLFPSRFVGGVAIIEMKFSVRYFAPV